MGSTGSTGGNTSGFADFYKGYPDAGELLATFNAKVNNQDLLNAFRKYAYGTYGDENAKAAFDAQYKISDFIDKNTSLKQHNATLYRGVILTDAELNALKVGGDAGISGLTSWSDREIVGHMYAVGDEYGNTMRGIAGNPVVFIESRTNDAIPLPHTYPHNELLRSNSMGYTVTRIVSTEEYKGPIGRTRAFDDPTEYTQPVTYVYVKSHKIK